MVRGLYLRVITAKGAKIAKGFVGCSVGLSFGIGSETDVEQLAPVRIKPPLKRCSTHPRKGPFREVRVVRGSYLRVITAKGAKIAKGLLDVVMVSALGSAPLLKSSSLRYTYAALRERVSIFPVLCRS